MSPRWTPFTRRQPSPPEQEVPMTYMQPGSSPEDRLRIPIAAPAADEPASMEPEEPDPSEVLRIRIAPEAPAEEPRYDALPEPAPEARPETPASLLFAPKINVGGDNDGEINGIVLRMMRDLGVIELDEKTIRNICDDYMGSVIRNHEIYAPTILGIDEMKLGERKRTIFIDVDGHHSRACGSKCFPRGSIARLFHGDDVAGAEEGARDERQRHLAASRDDEVIGDHG